MPYHPDFPDDPLLREIAEMLDSNLSAAEIWDADLRQVFVSGEYMRGVGVTSPEQLGTLGLEPFHADTYAARARWPWPAASADQIAPWFASHGGMLVRQVGLDRIRAVAPQEIADAAAAADPQREWVMSELTATQEVGALSFSVRATVTAITGADGRLRGVVSVMGPAISAHIITMLAIGDVANFERLTHLIEPGVRPAAILFADLEGSTRLARELPTRAYFDLISQFVATFDACAVEHAGVVGKHAGDGASAFFLVQECGSASAAAAAAIRTAREAAARLPGGLRLNAAAHWGERILAGNLASAARLEATAFGEEVNEAARVESVATGGTLLATKALIERLDDADAAALGIDPHVGSYTLLGDMPGAGEKARRDAGSLAVRSLPLDAGTLAGAMRVWMPLPDTDFDTTEAAVPWKVLRERGHEVVVATERGGDAPACDPRLIDGVIFGRLGAKPPAIAAYRELQRAPEFIAPVAWGEIEPDSFDGLLLPGGHAPGMRQYLGSAQLQRKVAEFWARGRPVGAICHGVLVLARAGVLGASRTTCLTKAMERSAYLATAWKLGRYYRTYPAYVQDEVVASLDDPEQFDAGPRSLKQPFVVEDGRYVSARWPGDAELFAQRFSALLSAGPRSQPVAATPPPAT